MTYLFAGPIALMMAALSGAAKAGENDGQALYQKDCQQCHTLSADEPRRQGPPLNGVIGRIAGSVEGFPYSKGLKNSGQPWTDEQLDAWLANPKQVFADTYMMYKQDDPEVRSEIISFLKTVAE